MVKIAVIFGGLLCLQGLGFYFGLAAAEGERPSLTAMIPAFFGLPIIAFGLLGLKESMRMHAMHGVATLALLGFLLAAGRLMMMLASGGEIKATSGGSLGLMALLCGTLSGLCVKSFIDARRHRREQEAGAASD